MGKACARDDSPSSFSNWSEPAVEPPTLMDRDFSSPRMQLSRATSFDSRCPEVTPPKLPLESRRGDQELWIRSKMRPAGAAADWVPLAPSESEESDDGAAKYC